mmetsp:Transcript_15588/g.40319  ORF Transcript_15588/g.40319 Transcript_15588/m.40319 type:complete len:210 (-) Transcript_15588:88-717(-)
MLAPTHLFVLGFGHRALTTTLATTLAAPSKSRTAAALLAYLWRIVNVDTEVVTAVACTLALLAQLGDLLDIAFLLLLACLKNLLLNLLAKFLVRLLLAPLLGCCYVRLLLQHASFHFEHMLVGLAHLCKIIIRPHVWHSESIEARLRHMHSVERLVVERELALEVIIRVIELQRLGCCHCERLNPGGIISFRVHATREILQLDKQCCVV